MKNMKKSKTPKILVELVAFVLCVIGGVVAFALNGSDIADRAGYESLQWYFVAGIGALFVLNLIRLLVFRRPVSSAFTVWTLLGAIVLMDGFILCYTDKIRAPLAVAAIFFLWIFVLAGGKIVHPVSEEPDGESLDETETVHEDELWQEETKEFLEATYIKNKDDPDGTDVVGCFVQRYSHKLYFFHGVDLGLEKGDLATYRGDDGQMHSVVVVLPRVRRDISGMTRTLPTLQHYIRQD